MIKSFKCKETEKIFNRRFSKKLPQNIQRTVLKKLNIIDVSDTLSILKIPSSNRLESLKGKREGQYSIRINDQWRICFKWDNGAIDVEIEDYH